MAVQIGGPRDHGFDEPLELMNDCHRRIEHFLEVLVVLTETNRGGALTPSHRHAMETALRYFQHSAPHHTADEEESLFPRLEASADPRAAEMRPVLRELLADHAAAALIHAESHELIARWMAEGSLDAAAAQRLLSLLGELQTMYRRHIHQEGTCIFRLAAQMLGTSELAAVGREMARRRGVEGCAGSSPGKSGI